MGVRMSSKQYESLLSKDLNPTKSKKNKYHNKKPIVNGIRFDSNHELKRYQMLLSMEKTGDIQDLRFHNKKDTLILLSDPLLKYEPDFCYFENGIMIIEDVKGMQTKDFIIKKKLIISKIYKKEIMGVFRITKYNKYIGFETVEEYSFEKKRN